MKLIRATKDRFLFHLGKREKSLLLELLKLYPAFHIVIGVFSLSALLLWAVIRWRKAVFGAARFPYN